MDNSNCYELNYLVLLPTNWFLDYSTERSIRLDHYLKLRSIKLAVFISFGLKLDFYFLKVKVKELVAFTSFGLMVDFLTY